MEAAVTTRNCWLGGFLAPGLLRRWKTLSLEVQLAPHHQVKNHSIILPWCRRNHCIGKQKTPEELKNLLGINILIKKIDWRFLSGEMFDSTKILLSAVAQQRKKLRTREKSRKPTHKRSQWELICEALALKFNSATM